MNPLQSVIEMIDEQLEPLDREHEQLTERLRVIDEMRFSLREMRKQAVPSKSAKTRGGKAQKPSPRKADVMEVLVGLVKDNQPIARQDLESLAKHTLKAERGFCLSGAALLIKKCLGTDSFTVSKDDRVSCPSENSTADTAVKQVLAHQPS
ncbi:MAG: hypothetical protein AAFX06_29810 [Planctomycetota bacterium]